MSKMRLVLLGIVATGLLLAPGASAQAPTQDSVNGSLTRGLGGRDTITWNISATSGPSGESPSGTLEATGLFRPPPFPVTCLQVTGNRAVIGGRVTDGATVVYAYLIVVDEPGDVQDRLIHQFFVNDPAAPPTCAAFDAQVGGTPPPPASSGSVTVIDAQPLPTSKDQCRRGGWTQYGRFKNQGDCVSFVRHQAHLACIFERVANGAAAFRAKYGIGPLHQFAMWACVHGRIGF